MAHMRCALDTKAECTYAHAHAHAPMYPHSRTRNDAHTDQYIILIAFPLQQRFRERASMSRYTYIACLVTVVCVLVYEIIFTYLIL